VVAHRLHRCPHVDVPEPDRAVAGAHRSSYAMMMEAYKNGATDPTFLYSAPGWADGARRDLLLLCRVLPVVPIFVLVSVGC
jgi:hypothetical protein